MGDFVRRMNLIADRVGTGLLVGSDLNENVYAHYQHEGATFKRPHGGGPFFYLLPLMNGAPEYMQAIADHLLTDGGADSMKSAIQKFETRSQAATGKETGRLANGHDLTVLDDGARAYHRDPTMPPLREGDRDPLRTNRRRRT